MIDITGQKFGSWTVISMAGQYKNRSFMWLCECECGKRKIVHGEHLRNGRSKSCGCTRNHAIIHGDCNSRLYRIWRAMNARCRKHKNYGGRGISVCCEWAEYKNFKEWAISNGYTDDLTIDRVNNDGNYEPSNCRWVSMHEQSRNRRTNVFITYNGKTQVISDWANELGLRFETIARRHKCGWSVEECLFGRNTFDYNVDSDHNYRNRQKFITHEGKTQNLYQWSKEKGINYNTLMKRHKNGWFDDECILGRRKTPCS